MPSQARFPVSANFLLTLAVVSGAGAVTPVPVAAQEGMLEEVIVTARRREESLQETPVAVTAFGQDDAGELYVIVADGSVFRLEPEEA